MRMTTESPQLRMRMTLELGLFAPHFMRMRMTPENPLFAHAHLAEIRVNETKN